MQSKDRCEKIKNETSLLVNLFLENNASDTTLAKMTGISAATVGRRLINKEYYDLCFGKKSDEIYEKVRKKRQENLLTGKRIGGQKSAINSALYKSIDSTYMKIDLGIIYKEKSKQIKFLAHAALNFRLHLDSLSSILQIDKKTIEEMFTNNVSNLIPSLNYLFSHDFKNQDIAISNFLDYYKEILSAIQKKDIKTRNNLIKKVGDYKILKMMKNMPEKINETDFDTLVHYQIKYAINNEALAKTFNITVKEYNNLIIKYLKNDYELKKELVDLMKYYKNIKSGVKND